MAATSTSATRWESTLLRQRGVCGGGPTIRYRRLYARHIIARLRGGDSVRQAARNYRISVAAVNEAVKLASVYDYKKAYLG